MRAAGLVSPAFSARIGQAHAAPLRVQIRASHFPCTALRVRVRVRICALFLPLGLQIRGFRYLSFTSPLA